MSAPRAVVRVTTPPARTMSTVRLIPVTMFSEASHARFRHRRRRPYADRQAVGCARRLLGHGSGRLRHRRALEKAGVARRARRLRDHGPGAAGRRRPDHRPVRLRSRAASRWTCPRHDQQGVPVRARRDRPRRPADRERRGRRRGRRRHGVDDQRAAPAARRPRAATGTATHARRRHGATTACSAPSTDVRDGRRHRERHNGGRRHHAARSRTRSRPLAPARGGGDEGRPVRRRDRAGQIPQRKGDPIVVETDEGVRAGHDRGDARPAAAGLRQGRHDHRRLRVADLRRRAPPSW